MAKKRFSSAHVHVVGVQNYKLCFFNRVLRLDESILQSCLRS